MSAPLFPRPSAAELEARLVRERERLAQSNGEAYTEIQGNIASLEAMLAQLRRET